MTVFLVGRDRDGFWIVRDDRGLVGGLFTSEAAAYRFAILESRHRAGVVITASGPLTLFCAIAAPWLGSRGGTS